MNFLPKENKIVFKKEYLARLWVVAGFGFFLIICIAVLLLFVPLLSLIYQRKIIDQELAFSKRRLELDKISVLSPAIEDLNKDIAILSDIEKKKSISKTGVLDKLLRLKNSRIKINRLIVGNEKITVSGRADSRNDFINFTDLLRKENEFKKVDAPISSLIKNTNVEFIIDIQL